MNELIKMNVKELDVLLSNKVVVDCPFHWHSKMGDIDVRDMETSHLYNTLKMIWNHCVESNLRWEFTRGYHFCPLKYNKDYMRASVVAIAREMLERDDIEKWHLNFIEHVKKHVNKLKRLH